VAGLARRVFLRKEIVGGLSKTTEQKGRFRSLDSLAPLTHLQLVVNFVKAVERIFSAPAVIADVPAQKVWVGLDSIHARQDVFPVCGRVESAGFIHKLKGLAGERPAEVHVVGLADVEDLVQFGWVEGLKRIHLEVVKTENAKHCEVVQSCLEAQPALQVLAPSEKRGIVSILINQQIKLTISPPSTCARTSRC